MKKIRDSYILFFKNRAFLTSLAVSFIMLFTAFFINFYAGVYATEHASNPVTDIVLNNIRVYDVDAIFVYGALVFWGFFIIVALLRPQKIPYSLKAISLFILIRSLFISLTHIGPFPTQIALTVNTIISKFSFGADLFFSGHTGLPFLLALIFWDTPRLRYIFIGTSIMFAAVVLLGHLHYSIDVLSAYFITFTIHHIAEKLFKKDKEFFSSTIEDQQQMPLLAND